MRMRKMGVFMGYYIDSTQFIWVLKIVVFDFDRYTEAGAEQTQKKPRCFYPVPEVALLAPGADSFTYDVVNACDTSPPACENK